MVVVDRALPRDGREAGREFAGGVHIAQKDRRYGIAHADAEMPGFQDNGQILRLPAECQRPTVHQHGDHRLAGSQ